MHCFQGFSVCCFILHFRTISSFRNSINACIGAISQHGILIDEKACKYIAAKSIDEAVEKYGGFCGVKQSNFIDYVFVVYSSSFFNFLFLCWIWMWEV